MRRPEQVIPEEHPTAAGCESQGLPVRAKSERDEMPGVRGNREAPQLPPVGQVPDLDQAFVLGPCHDQIVPIADMNIRQGLMVALDEEPAYDLCGLSIVDPQAVLPVEEELLIVAGEDPRMIHIAQHRIRHQTVGLRE